MPIEGGKGGAPTPFSNAFKGAHVNSLRYNTSQKGSPVVVCYGTQRLNVNVIGGFGFKGGGGGKKGTGKGGGGKGSKKGGANFSVNAAFAICQGPISFSGAPDASSGHNKVWADGGVGTTNTVPLNYYLGNDGAAADPVFASSSNDPPILGYSGTAYVTGTPLQLGSSPVLPNVQFEITGVGVNTAGGNFPGDASPGFIITDLLTNARYGAGFPAANLDTAGSLADFTTYCQAAGLAMSVVMDRQQPAARWVEEICQLTVAAPVWAGALLKIIPYFAGALSGFGASWTPVLTVQYALGDSDFLEWSSGGGGGGSDPVVVTRADPAAATNWMGMEFQSRFYSYNQEVVPAFDQGAIDLYGLHQEPSVVAPGVTNPTSAMASGQLQLNRKLYVRNTFKFKLGVRFSLLEPMDIVALTDATLGLSATSVRIVQIDEDDNGELTIAAEEIPVPLP